MMASQAASDRPRDAPPPPPPASASLRGGVALPPSQAKLQQSFDHGIWYLLSLWPALHVACQNSWGGPESQDKKDWFAGAVSDLFASRPETDHDDLVMFLLQVMQDEFECRVEDDSEEEVARSVMALRKRLFEDGDMGAFREVEQRWRSRGQMKVDVRVVEGDDDDDEEWEGFDEEDEDGDISMEAAEDIVPNLVPTLKNHKPEPEVDEEGFTKVVSKKKR